METKTPEPAAILQSHLGYWLRLVSNHVSTEFKRALHARQTSVAEWVVLCQVREHPGITPGELARSLTLTRGAVSKIIDKLEAKRWITASTSSADSRVRHHSLTRWGSRVLPELQQIADRNDHAFFHVLPENERATLQRLLHKLIERHAIRTVPVE